MNPLVNVLLAAGEPSTASFTMAETILFYCVAVFMVACALAVGLAKKAAHSAIAMVGVMLGLAVIYFSQDAVFLSVVQVVVYTGAIMILFLFVLMLVGVAASDNYQKTRPAWRIGAWALGIIGAALLVVTFSISHLPATGGIAMPDSLDHVTNPQMLALYIFSTHSLTMELTGFLLILAALGAVTLTHSDALLKVRKQPETAEARLQAYAASGIHPGQQTAPGVYAQNNAPDTPALSGETHEPVEASVPRVLRAQNYDRPLGQVAPAAVKRIQAEKLGKPEEGLHSIEASRAVGQSGAWGMPGDTRGMNLTQPQTRDVRPKAVAEGTAHKAVEAKDKEADK